MRIASGSHDVRNLPAADTAHAYTWDLGHGPKDEIRMFNLSTNFERDQRKCPEKP